MAKYKYSDILKRWREVTIFDEEYEEPPLSTMWWISFVGFWTIDILLLVLIIYNN